MAILEVVVCLRTIAAYNPDRLDVNEGWGVVFDALRLTG